jgi:hypothetical protein
MYVMQHVMCIIDTRIAHILTNDIGTPPEWIKCLVDMLNTVMVHTHPHLTSNDDRYARMCEMYSEKIMNDMDYPVYDPTYGCGTVKGGFPFTVRTCDILHAASPMAVVDIDEVSVHYVVSVLCPLFIDIAHYPNSTAKMLHRSKRW